MLADSAASAMAAVVLEALAIPCRPASKGGAASAGTAGSKGSGNSSKGSGKDSRGSATGSGGEGGKLARPPPPLAEQLAAAGYLADLTWMLEHAGSGGPAAGGSPRGSAPASGPSAGLWAAYNALAAIAGWLEGAVLHSSFPGSTIPQPSVALQAAAARSAVAMVSAARGMMGAGSGSGPAANGSGSNSGAAAAGAKQRWQAGGKLCRMASTGMFLPSRCTCLRSLKDLAAHKTTSRTNMARAALCRRQHPGGLRCHKQHAAGGGAARRRSRCGAGSRHCRPGTSLLLACCTLRQPQHGLEVLAYKVQRRPLDGLKQHGARRLLRLSSDVSPGS